MAYYHANFMLSFILLYLFYFLFLSRMPGNSLSRSLPVLEEEEEGCCQYFLAERP